MSPSNSDPKASFSAVITDIRLESRIAGVARWQIALDYTLFSSTRSTGILLAVSPSGARLEVPVLGVHEDNGTLWHVVDKPLTDGTKVEAQVSECLQS